jgi:hypothetical protein
MLMLVSSSSKVVVEMQLTRRPIVEVNVRYVFLDVWTFLTPRESLSVSIAFLMSFIYDEGLVETGRDKSEPPLGSTRQYKSTNGSFRPFQGKSTMTLKLLGLYCP